MPYSESASPGKRLSNADRNSSTASITKPSPPTKGKGHRAHLAGHGRVHTRNASYGKNLNKLTKLTDEDAAAGGKTTKTGAKSPISPSSGPPVHVKRNSSTVSLPRTGSKVNVKRNSSNVSLKRNTSHTQISKGPRPTTPLRKNHSRQADLDKLGQHREARFILDDDDDDGPEEDHDDEWTEESASQSPSVTRQSSSSKRTSSKGTPGDPVSRAERPHPPVSPPASPPLSPSRVEHSSSKSHSGEYIAVAHPADPTRTPRPPDADALTSRLLGRNPSFKLEPQVSSISATGTPGNHTPPAAFQSGDQPAGSSLPDHGVSRFLGATSSLSGSTYHLNNALNHLQRHPSYSGASSLRSSPPNTDPDPIRRSKSSGNLAFAPRPTIRLDSPESDGGGGAAAGKQSVRSYTFEPAQQRRTNFTQVRMELWRNQTAIEPSHGPPAPIISRLPVTELGTEERRVRQWDEAETHITYLKRFRNPVVGGARRALRAQKRQDARAGERPAGKTGKTGGTTGTNRSGPAAKGKARDGLRLADGTRLGLGDHHGATSDLDAHRRGRGPDSRPPSRGGPRSVRFEVGLDGGAEMGGDEAEGAEHGLDALIRSMWSGGELETGGEE